MYRTIPNAIPSDIATQERLIGAFLAALMVFDVGPSSTPGGRALIIAAQIGHPVLTLWVLPPSIRFHPAQWNVVTHGNVTGVLGIFACR